jgi:hypothetical protein
MAAQVNQMKAKNEAAFADLRKKATDSQNVLDALADKHDSMSSGAYNDVVPRYYRALVDHAAKQTLLSRYEARAEIPSDAELAEANNLLTSGNNKEAVDHFTVLERRYLALASLRQTIEKELAQDRMNAAQPLVGIWSDGGCGPGASRWSLTDGLLHVSWPGHGEYVERLLGEQEGGIYTEGVSQNDSPGQLMRYTPMDRVLTIDTYGEQHMQMRFTRC